MIRLIIFLLLSSPTFVVAQDDLMALATDSNETQLANATFKATRIINGHSVETVGKYNMDFIISHRFDRLNRGFDDFFGLDAATNRLALEYGLTNDVMVGIGRSSFEKNYDFFGKFRLLRQSTGRNAIPISLTAFTGYSLRTFKSDPRRTGRERSSYTGQLLIARKFGEALSLQISPTYIYRERPDVFTDLKSVFATGLGGRLKITKRTSVNGEYNYVFPNQIDDRYKNNLSFSYDIETGGHVFQLLFTNSFGMVERQFITETDGSWSDGDIHFGFNISRTFSFAKRSKPQ